MIRILYIEDKEKDQKIFRKTLSACELQGKLWIVSNLKEAESAIREKEIDVVFCSYELKTGTGLELIERINLLGEVPIIILSEAPNVQITRDSLKEGAFDFLAKADLSSAILERIINSAVRSTRENKLRDDLERRLDSIYSNTRTILENTTDGIWSLDEKGKLLIMNSIAKDNIKQHGDKSPAIGEDFFSNISPLFKNIWEPVFQQVLKGEDVITVDEYDDNGYRFFLEMACTPIFSNNETVGVSFVARNVTEREMAEAKVRESEKNFRSVFTGSDVPIMLLSTSNFQIVDLNEACARLHEQEREDMMSTLLFDCIPFEYLDKFKEDFVNYLGRKTEVLDSFIQTRNNLVIPVELSVGEITYNDEPCYLMFLYDISARVETENKLKEARELAEKSAEFKSLFLANMSHEIRTPMNAMLGFADLLKKTTLDAEQKEYLEIIRNSGQDLLVIINDILDLTKIEAGKLELRPKNFVLVDAINKVIRLHKEKAKEKGIGLTLELDGALPDDVFMDDIRLTQILNNLVSNALKFTEQGEVKIKISFRAGTPGDYIVIIVKDSGIGIPAVELETIFENFNQVDSSLQRKHSGTGLGLSIVSQLCELMSGEITARSKVGEGSEFEVRIPLVESNEQVESDPIYKKELLSDELHILICEDNPINVKLATKILDDLGIFYRVAANGKLGVEACKEQEPDAIFMDLQMPVMDGYEATREIRKFSEVPIIAMSAHVLEEEQGKCLEAGMNGFIPKPFQPEDIIQELQNQFSFGAIKGTSEVQDKWKSLNMPGLTNLAKGDEEFAVSLFDIFIEQATADLHKFEAAFEKGNKDELKSIAHKLLPSFMMFDFVQLHIVAEKIENEEASQDEMKYFIENLQLAVNEIQEKRSSFIQGN